MQPYIRFGYDTLEAMPPGPSFRDALRSGLHRRCPFCQQGRLFRAWPNRMLLRCPVCGLSYFRESGYYVGGMMFTYGLAAIALLIAYFALSPFPDVKFLTDNERLALWITFAVILTLALMPYAYSLWLSLDYWMEPWSPGDSDLE